MTKGYLRRTCHICHRQGVVPKVEDYNHMHKDPERWVFWAASPFHQEINGEDVFYWWCESCFQDDADDI
jgi:cytochrome c5